MKKRKRKNQDFEKSPSVFIATQMEETGKKHVQKSMKKRGWGAADGEARKRKERWSTGRGK